MNDFEKLINASDLIEWIMETYPDWCEGAVRSIVDHVDDMPPAQPAPCEFCKHNNIADDKACLMCSAERRTDEGD